MTAENELFREYKKTHDKKIRDELVSRYIYVAKILAYKSAAYGAEFDDLYQVACVGILLAIDRFDPDRGIQFSTFLAPTVMGEIKRFMRDKSHPIRLPRKLYETLVKAESERRISGNISIGELAKRLDIPEKTLREAYSAGDAAFISSLDDFSGGDRSADAAGYDDSGFAVIENRDFLEYCISTLTEKEHTVFLLRFTEGKTQKEAADAMGVSQMTVSRLERKIVEKIKNAFKTS